MFLISGFRLVTGKDDESYIKLFKLLQSGELQILETVQEPIFSFITKIIGLFFNEDFFFLFFSFISIYLLYKVCIKYTGYTIIPIIIYFSHKFIHNDLNQIRQGIISLAFLLIIDSKKISFKKIILSTGIHTSSLLFIPVSYFKQQNFTNSKTYIFFILISFIFSFYITSSLFLSLFENSIYISYLIDSRYNQSINLLANPNFYKTTILVALILYNFKKYTLEINKFSTLFNVYFIGYILFIIFRNISILSGRISSIFFVSEPFIIYLMYMNINKKYKPFSLFFIILVTIFQLYYNLFLTNNKPFI